MRDPIILPPEAYDLLMGSISTFGIGKDAWMVDANGEQVAWPHKAVRPVCWVGHCRFLGLIATVRETYHINVIMNDAAIELINAAKGAPSDALVSWDEYRSYMNIVRGDA